MVAVDPEGVCGELWLSWIKVVSLYYKDTTLIHECLIIVGRPCLRLPAIISYFRSQCACAHESLHHFRTEESHCITSGLSGRRKIKENFRLSSRRICEKSNKVFSLFYFSIGKYSYDRRIRETINQITITLIHHPSPYDRQRWRLTGKVSPLFIFQSARGYQVMKADVSRAFCCCFLFCVGIIFKRF